MISFFQHYLGTSLCKQLCCNSFFRSFIGIFFHLFILPIHMNYQPPWHSHFFSRISMLSLLSVQSFTISLTLSWRRPLSYRNQSIDLLSKSMDWFLYDNAPRHERVVLNVFVVLIYPLLSFTVFWSFPPLVLLLLMSLIVVFISSEFSISDFIGENIWLSWICFPLKFLLVPGKDFDVK